MKTLKNNFYAGVCNTPLLAMTAFLLCLACMPAAAQSTDQNYIKTTTMAGENGTQEIVTVQYFDGLGRPMETVQKGITPTGKDLAAIQEYDAFGRESNAWLPVPTTQNTGNFTSVNSLKTTATTFYSDNRPYIEPIYEPSPLNRVLGSKRAGAAWDTHPQTQAHKTNAANEVKHFVINAAGKLERQGFYDLATLYKTEVKDEDGKSLTTYTDKLGQVVMTRQSSDHDTYYVYDDFGNKRYVLPPLAVDKLGNANGEIADNNQLIDYYAYIYKYDERNRQISKKIAGCKPIEMVYDRADRLVMSQDGNQNEKSPKEWTVNKYDNLGRLVLTGTIESNTSADAWRQTLKTQLVITEYTAGSGYNLSFNGLAITPLITNYYDNYQFVTDKNITELAYVENSDYGKAFKKSPPEGDLGGLTSLNAKTYLTGTTVNILGTSDYLHTAIYYDMRGNAVQTRATNHLNRYDIAMTKYDFTGNPLKTVKTHSRPVNFATEQTTETYRYEYDHALRPTNTYYTLNSNAEILLSKNEYDELGRLKKKYRANNADTEEYEYNIQNWITKIKSGAFWEEMFYNINPENKNLCFNGNISYSEWKYNNTDRAYLYTYDALNRLTNAHYCQTLPEDNEYWYNESFGYDKMGNIAGMSRYNDDHEMDNLFFKYKGNQVINIYDDDGIGGSRYNVKEYVNRNYNENTVEFEYDANGNLIKDLDRQIIEIKYNLLNLPTETTFSDGNKIINIYDAAGVKLETYNITSISTVNVPVIDSWLSGGQIKRPASRTVTTGYGTQYAGNIEYLFDREITEDRTFIDMNGNGLISENFNITNKRIHNPEGYYANNQQYYYRKDHLGNNREVFYVSATLWGRYGLGGAEINTVQRTQYYPSGLPIESTAADNAGLQPYKFNSCEFVEVHGLDVTDLGNRAVYNAINRFTTVDRFAEKFPWQSPYVHAGNNSVNYVDVNGDWIQYRDSTGSYRYENGQWYQYQTQGQNKGTYTAFTPQSGSFMEGVLNGLNDLGKNSETGQKLLDFFANDTYDVIIKQGTSNQADLERHEITLDVNLQGSIIPTEFGLQTSPFWLDIGHELAHRKDVELYGKTQAQALWLTQSTDRIDVKTTEKYATHIENQIRADAGLPLRTHYVSQGTGGYANSAILTSGGNGISLFYGTNYRVDALGRKINNMVRRMLK